MLLRIGKLFLPIKSLPIRSSISSEFMYDSHFINRSLYTGLGAVARGGRDRQENRRRSSSMDVAPPRVGGAIAVARTHPNELVLFSSLSLLTHNCTVQVIHPSTQECIVF
jgi:hypothetical protein